MKLTVNNKINFNVINRNIEKIS